MPLVRMLVTDGDNARGFTYEVSGKRAQELVKAGAAEYETGSAPEIPESRQQAPERRA